MENHVGLTAEALPHSVPQPLPIVSLRKLQQASGSLEYRFEELGLEIENGFSAGSFTGTAHITYWLDEGHIEWFVGGIVLECHRWNGKTHDVQHITLDYFVGDKSFLGRLYLQLYEVLTEGPFKDSIQARVEESQ